MCPKDVDGMANSGDPDQTAPIYFGILGTFALPKLLFLARLDEVQEELLYYLWRRRRQNVKVFTLKFFM